MNRTDRTSGLLAACAALLALAACGDGGSDAPQVKVDDLSTGRYTVSLGDANSPTVGKYYASADGSRLLIAANADDHATQVYRRNANEAWAAAPAFDRDITVTLLQSNALASNTVALSSVAGRYVSAVAVGVTASFNVDAAGNIIAGASACKLSGKLSAGRLPNTLRLDLASAGCGALPATSSGVLVVDADDAPAAFRLVADNGTQIVDLWAFTE